MIPYLLEEAAQAQEVNDGRRLSAALDATCLDVDAYGAETRRQLADALKQRADHEDLSVRYDVVRGLGKVGYVSDIRLLESVATSDPGQWVSPVDSEGNQVRTIIHPVRDLAVEAIEKINGRLAEMEAVEDAAAAAVSTGEADATMPQALR